MTKPMAICRTVLLVIASSVVLFHVAHAQVDEKRPSFFQGNYAKGVAETGTAAPETGAGHKKFELDLSAAPPDIQKSMREYMQARQIPARDFPPPMVLLVINSKDAGHLTQVVQKALSLDTKGIVHISEITHIGDYRTLSEDLAVKLRARKIPYKADTTAPLGLPVTRSPAWVFLGPAGARIVEGTLDLEQYVTPLGQYKDPRWVDAPSRGSGEVKGF
jgi:hypothetical protein